MCCTNMCLEEAMNVLREIATGDKERLAFLEVEYELDAYRALYEGAEKRLQRFRDLASKPDLPEPLFPNHKATIENPAKPIS